jgi:hypothetical protein
MMRRRWDRAKRRRCHGRKRRGGWQRCPPWHEIPDAVAPRLRPPAPPFPGGASHLVAAGELLGGMPAAAADPPVLLVRRRVEVVDRLRGLFRFAEPR